MAWQVTRSVQNREPDSVYFGDCNLVYVRDRHGTLHHPPGYDYEGSKRCWSMPPTQDPVVHGATCSVKTGLTEVSACKLYQICKNFIARNLHLVESLLDFPEEIGYEIFQEALQMKIFHHNPEYINMFSIAYQKLVVKHLSLKQETVFINENSQFLQSFNCLTKLDLAHCRLGDKHEYLVWIGKVKSLECICLKDNCLTDHGISSWTLPHRMFNSGPELLRILDLSCNPGITDSSAKCLVKFINLKSINLSATSFTIADGIQKIMRSTNLKLVSYIREFSKEAFTKTKGWASPIIADLSSKSKCVKSGIPKPSSETRKKFYQTTRCSDAVKVNRIKERSDDINLNNYPTLLLQSEELVLPDTLRDIDMSSVKQNRKRSDSELLSPSSCKKRKITTHDTLLSQTAGEDFHENTRKLLESYLKY